jgi:glycosyltransferase involved in cell wall biosynthesis
MDFGLVTVASAAFVPAARAMIDSARQAGFRGSVHAFVLDRRPDAGALDHGWSDGFAVLPDPALARRFAPLGLERVAAAAVPAALLAALHEQPAVAFLAPSVHVLAAIDDLVALADERLVLVERPRGAAPADGLHPDERDLAHARRYASWALGASSAATAALEWWRDTAWTALVEGDDLDADALLDRLAHRFGAIVPPLPSRFADWYSLGVDQLHDDGRTVHVHGHELAAVDLRGYDDHHPHRIDNRRPRPDRVTLADVPTLADAIARRPSLTREDEQLSLPNGLRFDRIMQAAYHAALHDSRRDGERWPPDPSDDAEGFVDWLRASPFPTTERVSRYLRHVYLSRPDLSRAFPEVPGRDTERFFAWANDHGRDEIPIPDAFIPPRTIAAHPSLGRNASSTSVNLVGFLDASLGIGEVARRLGRALDAAGVVHADLAFTARRDTASSFDARAVPHDTNIVCINPDSLVRFIEHAGESFVRDRYTIGVWFWETAELAPSMAWAFDLVDEVWAASEFVAQAIRARAPARVPVNLVRLPLLAPPTDPGFALADVGVVDRVPTFLASWDYQSVVDRKNPLAVIDAYRNAFTATDGTQLLLKSTNAQKRPDAHERVRFAVGRRRDIRIVDDVLTAERNASLLAHSSCVVSLHRSEGLGLNLADAIALGVPVIATRYGGNVDFMRDDDTFLVPYRLVDVGPDNHPYQSDAQWAEPDTAAAAQMMRTVVDNPTFANARTRHAQERLAEEFGIAPAAASVAERLRRSSERRAPADGRRSLLKKSLRRS